MKTLLLVFGTAFFVMSCVNTNDAQLEEELSADEMKSTVEAEEIVFDDPSGDLLASIELQKPRKVDPYWGGCILEPGCLVPDSLVMVEEKPIVVVCPPSPMSPNPKSLVVEFPQVDAQYPGGMVEMRKFIYSNLAHPNEDGGFHAQGTVYISMVIAEDGKVEDVTVMRGVTKELDEEALRVVRMMPHWIPAEEGGKVVASKVRLPIRFTIN